jgi:hypothetical protein
MVSRHAVGLGIAREYLVAVRTPFPLRRHLVPRLALGMALCGCAGGASGTHARHPGDGGDPYAHIALPSEEGDDKVPPATQLEPVSGNDSDSDSDEESSAR